MKSGRGHHCLEQRLDPELARAFEMGDCIIDGRMKWACSCGKEVHMRILEMNEFHISTLYFYFLTSDRTDIPYS